MSRFLVNRLRLYSGLLLSLFLVGCKLTLNVSSTNQIEMNAGEAVNVVYSIKLAGDQRVLDKNKPVKITVTETMPTGADIIVSSNNPGSFIANQFETLTVDQAVSAAKEGTYKIVLKANIEGTNISSETTVTVNVAAKQEEVPPVLQVSSDAELLQLKRGKTQTVRYCISVVNNTGKTFDIAAIETVSSTGIQANSNNPGKFVVSKQKQTFTIDQAITAAAIGIYDLKLDVTISDFNITKSTALSITVIDQNVFELSPPLEADTPLAAEMPNYLRMRLNYNASESYKSSVHYKLESAVEGMTIHEKFGDLQWLPPKEMRGSVITIQVIASDEVESTVM